MKSGDSSTVTKAVCKVDIQLYFGKVDFSSIHLESPFKNCTTMQNPAMFKLLLLRDFHVKVTTETESKADNWGSFCVSKADTVHCKLYAVTKKPVREAISHVLDRRQLLIVNDFSAIFYLKNRTSLSPLTIFICKKLRFHNEYQPSWGLFY